MHHKTCTCVSSLALAALAALAAGCGGSSTSGAGGAAIAQSSLDRDPASGIPASSLAAAVTANNAFALDLYGRLASGQAGANLITSPLSASLALTMTYAGAAGETQTQMATALHVTDPSTIFGGQNALDQALGARAASALASATKESIGGTTPSASDYQLQVVNSVWGDKSYTWNEPFLDTLARSYGAGLREEDFIHDPADAITAINSWVSDATADKINNLLDSSMVTSDTRLVLVNAIHLKLPWDAPFDATQTKAQTFTRGDGTTVQAPLMNQTFLEATYADDGAAQVLELPLTGGELAVEIALPHGDLATYEAGLTATSAPFTGPKATGSVALSLPKASFTSATFSLKEPLQAMGMTDAFDASKANFSGMTSSGSPLYIGFVEQKAMVAMEESGVEAAAATAVGATEGAAPVASIVPMTVNKPYLLTIIDRTTRAVLFIGHISDPTNTGGE